MKHVENKLSRLFVCSLDTAASHKAFIYKENEEHEWYITPPGPPLSFKAVEDEWCQLKY